MSRALEHAYDETQLGAKAVHLGAALRAGLPVPAGFVFDAADRAAARAAVAALGPPVAVRSSGIGEDSAATSFAGQHVTCLGLLTEAAVAAAVARVADSAGAAGARAYRQRLGIDGVPRMAVIVQRLVPALRAGVVFTRCPLTGRDEAVVEASWGLGESVVAGAVTPDRYRLSRAGVLLEATLGIKDRELVACAEGGVRELRVDAGRARASCLDSADLAALHRLLARVDAAFGGGPHDVEFAFDAAGLWLLQRRAITTSMP